ncbi:MAG: formate dehydrogenase accessory sulfurtransferase FdhD [Verrucomicrobiota bacterium]
MASPISFDAVLIAGGQSSRFGTDKAVVDWKGEPLYLFQLSKLRDCRPDHLWLSAHAEQAFSDLPEDVTRIDDDEPAMGPMGGLVSIFRRSKAEFVLVLGVDLPLMTIEFLEGMLVRREGLVPRTSQFWEPMAALYPRQKMRSLIEIALKNNDRKLQRLIDQAHQEETIKELPVSDSEHLLFTNLNTREDLSRIDPDRKDDTVRLTRFREGESGRRVDDQVAREEPLEIRVNEQSVAVMMRTPGNDEELVMGFLVTESVIQAVDEILEIEHASELDPKALGNTMEVKLSGEADLEKLTRHVFTSSSCGVCGKATIDSVFQQFPPFQSRPAVKADLLLSLPDKLRRCQEIFDRTGGLHASALFNLDGELKLLREDVGRHNALDKVIGHATRATWDLSEMILLVSGRISFELTQKALAARLPVVVGISAPSSLAIQLAKESGQTLVGFLRESGFNVYAGEVLES